MAHRGPSRSGSAGYRRSHLPHARSDIDTLPSRRSSAGSETGDSFTDAGDDGVRVLCEQRDELERRMAVLSTQQRKLEQQMCALSPNGVASQATPPPPRPLRQPQLPPLPGWPLAFPPTAPHEPVFDQGMVPPPPPPPETPPPPKGGWSVVRSPADYSAQAPLPWHAQGAVPLLIDAMEGLMAVMGFSHEIADLTDMVDAVHKMTAALASRDAPPKAETSTAATSPIAAAAAPVSASPAYDREAEQMRVLKHRLKKREDELAALKAAAAAAGGRGLAVQPTQQPGRALSPPRRPQAAAAAAASAAPEQGSLVALAAAPEEHPTTGPEIRLAEIDEELATVQAQEEKYLSKETALRRSEEWWARKKQEAAFTHRQQVEELRSGGLLGDSEGEPQASDLSEYDTVVEESTLQCKRLTDRVKGLLEKLDADLVRAEQQLEAAAASRARLLAERADTLSLVHELASTREPSV